MGEDTCPRAWHSEFDLQHPYGGRRELTAVILPLASTCAHKHMHNEMQKVL